MTTPRAFSVASGQVAVLSGLSLLEGDAFEVHRVIDSKCAVEDSVDIPFSPNGEVLTLDYTHNPIQIKMPGLYRVYPAAANTDDAQVWVDMITCTSCME